MLSISITETRKLLIRLISNLEESKLPPDNHVRKKMMEVKMTYEIAICFQITCYDVDPK